MEHNTQRALLVKKALAQLARMCYNASVTQQRKVCNMQTAQRFARKQLNAQMQQAIAAYLQRNAVTVCKAAASSSKQQRSKHIGKNCATRCGARV